MIEISPVAFVLLSAVVLVPAVLVVLSENLFHSGIALITSFLGVAGIYVTLAAPFVAGMQVMVYAGAVAVILLFAFMLTHDLMRPLPGTAAMQRLPAALVALISGFVLLAVIGNSGWYTNEEATLAQTTSISNLGAEFLTRYLIPFELVSLLLLVTLIGAVVIARKEEEPPPA